MSQTRPKRNGTLVICSKIIVVRRMLGFGCPTVATNYMIALPYVHLSTNNK
jgi:hypothetical protein